MANKSMKAMAEKMRKLDICMLTTYTTRGHLATRPMSNNGDVEYDGNSYFFTFEESRTVKDIEAHPQVNMGFQGKDDLYISINGKASVIRNKATMAEHWLDELSQWFKEGLDTPGIVMIRVEASHMKYWQREDEGERSL